MPIHWSLLATHSYKKAYLINWYYATSMWYIIIIIIEINKTNNIYYATLKYTLVCTVTDTTIAHAYYAIY